MKILFWGSALFCLAFSLHLIIWKIRIPERQIKVLLQIFVGTSIIGLLSLWAVSNFIAVFSIYVPKDFSEYLHIILFLTSLILAYMVTYSAIEVDSPSLVIILKIADARTEGLEKSKLMETMNDDVLVKPRINDLITDKMAYVEGDKYKLTTKGSLMLSVITLYRKMLNEGKGG
jgi:hypothetical protein